MTTEKTSAGQAIENVRQSIEAVRSFAKLYNLPKKKFAERAGISERTLGGLYDDDWSPSVDTLHKLELAKQAYLEEHGVAG